MSLARTSLQLQQYARGIFDQVFNGYQELDRRFAVDQPVIIGQCQVHHGQNNNFTIYSYGSILNLVHT